MKKKNHETRVLVVVIITSKGQLQIPSARTTPVQTYLIAQVPSQFFILLIFPLFLFLFYTFFEKI